MSHVFISYVRQDEETVRRLAHALRVCGVDIWLDRERLAPGVRWQQAIREAIAAGAYFIACFSKKSAARDASYMNEELTLALEQLRRRPTDRAWFLPVLLENVELPPRSIG